MDEGGGGPRVSVVVPVRDRRASLRILLDALAAQTAGDAEVVVVDDGSTDGSGDEAEADTRAGRPVRVLRTPGVGAVAARRAGVAAARGEILAFTDSDCVPAPGWLAAGRAELDRGADLVNGRTVPARRPGPGERSLASGEEGLYPTCNLFVRRAAYDRVGGFDESAAARLGFRVGSRIQGLGFGEDTLLAWRVQRAGGMARYAPDAVVAHEVSRPDLPDALARTWVMAAFPALVREVPELRRTLLRGGVLLGGSRRLLLYGALLALLGRRRRAAAAGLTGWGLLRARALAASGADAATVVRALPGELLLEAMAAAALVTGSVRARTLVL